MISSKDFEKLWFLYQTEGASSGVSINSFCMQHYLLQTKKTALSNLLEIKLKQILIFVYFLKKEYLCCMKHL